MIVDFEARPGLARLRADFVRAGHDIRFVGGAVRCHFLGEASADIDLSTDATPDEQIALYRANGHRYVETGLQHGTLSVLIPGEDTYEITSLRTDHDHDGRHARVAYTRDWTADLARRDFTINAMSMTFEGVLVDPFGGRADLDARRVRFVGDAQARCREDYLRILRFLRFHGRICPEADLDAEAEAAIRACAPGLEAISRERVWKEMAKIATGPGNVAMMRAIDRLGIAGPIGLGDGSPEAVGIARARGLEPATTMAAYLGYDEAAVARLAAAWKWSSTEASLAIGVSSLVRDEPDYRRRLVLDSTEVLRPRFVELAKALGKPDLASDLARFETPRCPFGGDDLVALGLAPGREMGRLLGLARAAWYDAGCPQDPEAARTILAGTLAASADPV